MRINCSGIQHLESLNCLRLLVIQLTGIPALYHRLKSPDWVICISGIIGANRDTRTVVKLNPIRLTVHVF